MHSDEGDVAFEIDFGTDELGVRFADISIDTELNLLCQRSLEPFLYQVRRKTRLGLIENEEDEASLPAGYEPYIVPAEPLELVDLVEDELILALPVVPLGPQGPLDASFGPDKTDPDQTEQTSPFAVLARLKTKNLDKQK